MDNILVGYDNSGKKLELNFMHSELSNRHIYIPGKSGEGKTYSVQHLLKEASNCGLSAVLFDRANAFSESQIEQDFRDSIGNKLVFVDIRKTKVPINPFRLYTVDENGTRENAIEAASRISNLFSPVFGFGKQQDHVIYDFFRLFFIAQSGVETSTNLTSDEKTAILSIRSQIEENIQPLSIFRGYLKNDNNTLSDSQTRVLSKMAVVIDMELFEFKPFDWDKLIYSDGKIIVIELSGFQSDIRQIVLECMLWDLWEHARRRGSAQKPFITVFDECQDMNFTDDSPATKILTQGRKFGFSAWFITQFSRGKFDETTIGNLEQAATKLFFKPTDKDMFDIAKTIDREDPKLWLPYLKGLKKGQCIVKGCFVKQSKSTRSAEYSPIILNIPAL